MMNKNNPTFQLSLLLCTFFLWCLPSVSAQSPEQMFSKGLEMTHEAVESQNWGNYEEGIKLMEKAYKKHKDRADWCYEIAKAYYYYIPINGHLTAWNEKRGLQWLEEGVKLGDFYSALELYRHYRPNNPSRPLSVLSPLSRKKNWKQYQNRQNKCRKAAAVVMAAAIPENFNYYRDLADVAKFTHNDNLKNKYRALAFEREEYGALEELMNDLNATYYITSPSKMYDAAVAIWNKYYHDPNYSTHVKIGRDLFEKAAKSGDAAAQYQMARIYFKGLTVEPDTLKAVSWLKLAANEYPQAAYDLGVMYIDGMGIEKDPERGVEFLEKGSEEKDLKSILALGKCYLYGIGIPRDIAKSKELFERSSSRMPPSGILIDGLRIYDLDYLTGLGYYFENSPECVPLFEKSREKTSFRLSERNDLLLKLASCYQEGKFGVTPDPTKAADLIKEARELMKKEYPEITSENIYF